MTKPNAPTVHPVAHPGIAHPPAKSPLDPIGGTNGLLTIGLIGIICFAAATKPKTSKQGRSYWGGKAQLNSARRIGRKQIPAYNGKKSVGIISLRAFQSDAQYTKPNPFCLYIGTPDEIYNAHQEKFYAQLEPQLAAITAQFGTEAAEKVVAKYRAKKKKPFETITTLYCPSAEQSVAVLGASGYGKSRYVMNPLIRSALDQGVAVNVVDAKYPDQTKEIAGYAAQRGYKVQIIAPTYAESGTLNPYIFVQNSSDSPGAQQLSTTLSKNLSMGDATANGFFEDAGATVFESSILTAKWLAEDPLAISMTRRIWQLKPDDPLPPISDLLASAAIHNLPELSNRMRFARQRLNPWNYQSFVQLINTGSGDAGKKNVTEAGILGNAQKMINKLVKLAVIPSICGESDIEINIDGANAKTLTIFGLNQDYRTVAAPILSATLDLFVSYNLANSRQRKTPFATFIDELPLFYLENLATWLALYRSAGSSISIAFQTFVQLSEIYGENRAKTIAANCATTFWLNPQDGAMAQNYSDYLGTISHTYYTTSHTRQKGGNSTTRTENITEVPLMEAAEFLRMAPGQAVMYSPGYQNSRKKESSIPMRLDIHIPERDFIESQKSCEVWETMRAARQKPIDEAKITREFNLRYQLLDELLPLPPTKTSYPLKHLITRLSKSNYTDAGYQDVNQTIDLEQLVGVPDLWKDPNSPEDAPTVKLPTDPKNLDLMCILVQSTGYKIDPCAPTPAKTIALV